MAPIFDRLELVAARCFHEFATPWSGVARAKASSGEAGQWPGPRSSSLSGN